MSYYESQDAISKSFHIGLNHLFDLPFYRYQIMLKNFNKMVEADNKKNNTQNASNSTSLPNLSQIMKQGKQNLPRLSLPKK